MTVLFNGEVIEYEIKEMLNVFEKRGFIETVTEMVAPNKETLYTTMKEFAFNVALVSSFTNIFDYNEFDNDIRIMEFIENTNIVDCIKDYVDDDLLIELDKSVCLAVKAKTGVNINGFEYELGNVVNGVIKRIVDLKEVAEVTDNDEFKKFLERFSKEDLDAKKIVEEYFKSKEVNEQFK